MRCSRTDATRKRSSNCRARSSSTCMTAVAPSVCRRPRAAQNPAAPAESPMTSLANPASWLAGYMADLPTPFRADAELDLEAFATLCERQIEAGVSAIVVGETAGEASTLTTADKDRLIRCAVEIAQGRIHV